jgi:hypothetical protein
MQSKYLSLAFYLGPIAKMSSLQLLFFGLFIATWLIGINVLMALHYRRLGQPWWMGLKPLAFPFTKFNAREWLILLGLALVGLAFAFLAFDFFAYRH